MSNQRRAVKKISKLKWNTHWQAVTRKIIRFRILFFSFSWGARTQKQKLFSHSTRSLYLHSIINNYTHNITILGFFSSLYRRRACNSISTIHFFFTEISFHFWFFFFALAVGFSPFLLLVGSFSHSLPRYVCMFSCYFGVPLVVVVIIILSSILFSLFFCSKIFFLSGVVVVVGIQMG